MHFFYNVWKNTKCRANYVFHEIYKQGGKGYGCGYGLGHNGMKSGFGYGYGYDSDFGYGYSSGHRWMGLGSGYGSGSGGEIPIELLSTESPLELTEDGEQPLELIEEQYKQPLELIEDEEGDTWWALYWEDGLNYIYHSTRYTMNLELLFQASHDKMDQDKVFDLTNC